MVLRGTVAPPVSNVDTSTTTHNPYQCESSVSPIDGIILVEDDIKRSRTPISPDFITNKTTLVWSYSTNSGDGHCWTEVDDGASSTLQTTPESQTCSLSVQSELSSCVLQSEEDSDACLVSPHATTSPTSVRSILIVRPNEGMKDIYIQAKGPWRRLAPPDLEDVHRLRESYAATRLALQHQIGGDGATCDLSSSSEDEPNTSAPSSRRGVCFDAVHVRSYDQTIGDNPAVTIGTPIQLDWTYHDDEDSITVDAFETSRASHRRSGVKRLVINYYQRRNILSYQYGFTMEAIEKAEKQVDKIRRQRDITAALSQVWRVEDCVRSAARKTKRLVIRESTNQDY